MSNINKHGGNVHNFLKAKDPFFDFSANINPLKTPLINKTIKNHLNTLKYYPEAEAETLKKTLSCKYNINEKNIAIGNGSIELIYLIPRALNSKKALILYPTFSEYEGALKSYGTKITFLKLSEKNNFQLPIQKIIQKIAEVDLIFLCNPNNPTGQITDKDDLISLIDICKKQKTTLVIDEAFLDFTTKENQLTCLKETINNKYLLVLRSMTKFFQIPGLRLGFICGHVQTIAKIIKLQYPWNINSIAQIVGNTLITNDLFISNSKEYIAKEKDYLYQKLSAFTNLTVFKPSVNFILCKLKNGTADELQKQLRKKNILIRNCSTFKGLNNKFFRVAVNLRTENNILLDHLRKII